MSLESVIHSIDPVAFILDNDWLEQWIETAEIVERPSRHAQPFQAWDYEAIRFQILACLVFDRGSEYVNLGGRRTITLNGFVEQAGRLPRPTDRVRVRMTRIRFAPAQQIMRDAYETAVVRIAAVESLEILGRDGL